VSLSLPENIQRILIEVARTGSCRTLAWSRSATHTPRLDSNIPKAPISTSSSPNGDTATLFRKRPRVENTSHTNILLESFTSERNGLGDTCKDSPSETDTSFSSNLRYSFQSVESEHGSAIPSTQPEIFTNLKQVFQLAMATVLDYSYTYRGGYRTSVLEKRRMEQCMVATSNPSTTATESKDYDPNIAQTIFLQRRERLLLLLGKPISHGHTETVSDAVESRSTHGEKDDEEEEEEGPPFTMQRLAEILLMPDRVRIDSLCLYSKEISFTHLVSTLLLDQIYSIINKHTSCATL